MNFGNPPIIPKNAKKFKSGLTPKLTTSQNKIYERIGTFETKSFIIFEIQTNLMNGNHKYVSVKLEHK